MKTANILLTDGSFQDEPNWVVYIFLPSSHFQDDSFVTKKLGEDKLLLLGKLRMEFVPENADPDSLVEQSVKFRKDAGWTEEKAHDWLVDKGFIQDVFRLTDAIILDRFIGTAIPRRAKVLVTAADIVNRNGRTYTIESLKRAVDRAQPLVKSGQMVGFLEHPGADINADGEIKFRKDENPEVFRVKDLFIENRQVFAVVEFSDTEEGREIAANLSNGKDIFVSLRAIGDGCRQLRDFEVCEIAEIDGVDVVSSPALPIARMTQLIDNRSKAVMSKENTTRIPVTDCANEDNFSSVLHKVISFALKDSSQDDQQKFLNKVLAIVGDGQVIDGPGGFNKEEEEEESDGDGMGKKKSTSENSDKLDSVLKLLEGQLVKDDKVSDEELKALRELMGIRDELKSFADAQTKAKSAKQVSDAVENILSTSKLNNIDLSLFEETDIKTISDKAKKQATPEAAIQYMTDAFELLQNKGLLKKLEDKGFDKNKVIDNQLMGASSIEVTRNEQPYMPYIEKIRESSMGWRRQNRKDRLRDFELRSARSENKAFADMMFNEHIKQLEPELLRAAKYQRTIADSAEERAKREKFARLLLDSRTGRVPITDDLIGVNELRNQAFIVAEIQRQVFQNLEALQWFRGIGPSSIVPEVPGSARFGRMFRFSSQTYEPPTDGDPDFYVGPDDAIPEIQLFIRWDQEFCTRLRALSARLSTEMITNMALGPLGYDAIGEAAAQISDQLARTIDTNAYSELQLACDEFGHVDVTVGEAIAAADWTYSAGGSVEFPAGSGNIYGTNVHGAGFLLAGQTSPVGVPDTIPVPILRPRVTCTLDTSGLETLVTLNDITHPALIGGITQVRGRLDANRNIVKLKDDPALPDPTFAVDFDRRIVVFRDTATSGVAAGVRPTDFRYSYVTNFQRFDLTPTPGVRPEDYYNGLIYTYNQIAADIKQNRFVRPDTVLHSENIGSVVIPIASRFDKERSPASLRLDPNFGPGSIIGDYGGLNLASTNGILPSGDLRAIIFQNGQSAYGVSHPLEMKGPIQGHTAPPGGGRIRPTAQWVWYMQMMDVFGTPLVIDRNGTTLNFPGRTVLFLGSPTVV